MLTLLNNTLKTNQFDNYEHLKLLINICTLLSAIFAIIVSLSIIGYISVNYLLKSNFKKSDNVSLLLTCNTCLAIICSSTTLTLLTLSTIGGDRNIVALKEISLWNCYERGYLLFVFINSIYLSYFLQAGFRLFRIAFHKYKCLRTIRSFSYYIIVQWFSSFFFILPILIIGKDYSSLIVYLPQDFHCQVPMTSIRGIVFSILIVYFIPLCCIGMIHWWIIIYIRRKNGQLELMIRSVQQRTKRDAIIIKRIGVVMIVLLSLGVPSCIYVIIFIITGFLHWISYRIGWMTISISFALISLSSLYVTPQIYKPIHVLYRNTTQRRKKHNTSSSTNPTLRIRRKTEKLLLKQNTTTTIV